MKKRNLKLTPLLDFFLAISLFIISPFTLAQDTVVQGMIIDEEGIPLKGAKLTFEDPSRGLSFHIESDKNGKFIKIGIPPAVYHVTVALEKATEINPDALPAYFALGECYFAKGDSKKATKSFSKAIELEPENPMAFYNVGIVYYKLNKMEKALGAFDKTIELNPELSSAYYQAALSSIKTGDFERAIKYFEGFLKVEPNAPEAAQIKSMIEELKKRLK